MKPENILVRGSGHIALCDFDLSCPAESEKKHRPVAANGDMGFVGILEYLAPEVIKGSAHTKASDIYQVGRDLDCARSLLWTSVAKRSNVTSLHAIQPRLAC